MAIEPQEINYLVEGQGAPVILIHGLAASCYDWSALLPALAFAGYRAYAPDLIGHGKSPKPESVESYQAGIDLQHSGSLGRFFGTGPAARVHRSLFGWLPKFEV